ncbi:MAG: substrate-binding periplasmic protein [Kordiimonas sp.]
MYRLALTIIAALFSLSAYADTTKLTIATTHVPPYIIQQENGEASGIAIDLIDAASARCNIQTEYSLVSWARALKMSERGDVDAIMPLAKAKGRDKLFDFPITALLDFEMTIFGRTTDKLTFSGSMQELKGKTVGTLRSIIVSEAFAKAEKNGVFTRAKSDTYEALALGLSRNRLDVFVGEKQMGIWAIESLSLQSELAPIAPPIETLPVYLAFSKTGKSTLAVPFDACLRAELNSGKLAELISKYRQSSLQVANRTPTVDEKQ